MFFGQSSVSVVLDWINGRAETYVYHWAFDQSVIYAKLNCVFPIAPNEVSSIAHHWTENPYFFEELYSRKYRQGDYTLKVEKQYNSISLCCNGRPLVCVSVPTDTYAVLGNKLYKRNKMIGDGPTYLVQNPVNTSLRHLCTYAFDLIYA